MFSFPQANRHTRTH